MIKPRSLGLAVAFGLCIATSAVAQESGGIKVQGNTQINTNVKNVNTIAAGVGNTAKTSIGSVQGNKKGNTNITVDVKNVDNVVVGAHRKGCVNIASVGSTCE